MILEIINILREKLVCFLPTVFQTPPKPFRPKNEAERKIYKEMRRNTHISAEAKRRCNIKVKFVK